MRTRLICVPIVMATLAGTGLLISAPTAQAQAATCEGQAATITGPSPHRELRGSQGDDVIVTNGDTSVWGLEGDDLICVTGPRDEVLVSAGPGDDRVLNQTDEALVAVLGSGDDWFEGGPGRDDVDYGGYVEDDLSAGHDVISTMGGDDRVQSGLAGETNTDIVDLGSGRNSVRLELAPGDQPILQGGDGLDFMEVSTEGVGSWVTDNVEEHLTFDGQPVLTWARFDNFSVYARGTQSFLGGPGDEVVRMYSPSGFGMASASMGAGDDHLTLSISTTHGTDPGVGLSGGAGHDGLLVEPAYDVALRFDQLGGRFLVDSSAQTLSGFEDASLYASRVTVIGGPADNRFFANGCRVSVRGGSGDDVVETRHGNTPDGPNLCPDESSLRPHRLFGQGGDDTLTGGSRQDRLFGGPGRDLADGLGGKDVCRAERERHCER